MNKNVREPLRETEAMKILETMNDEYGISKVAELIKDNKIEFPLEKKEYRVRLLNTKEKDELDFLRRKYFGKLMQDTDILMEKDLIKIYKERGLDIGALDKDIQRLTTKIQSINYPLGESLANKAGDLILKTYREEIEKLTTQLYEVMIRRNHLLEYSFEQTLQNYVAKIISFLSLEIKENDVWIRAYNNIDDYIAADERLINLSATYSMTLHIRT